MSGKFGRRSVRSRGTGGPANELSRLRFEDRPEPSDRKIANHKDIMRSEDMMGTNDTNATPEQRRPKDVKPLPEDIRSADKGSLAPATVQPTGSKDESERPIVNPVTGAAL